MLDLAWEPPPLFIVAAVLAIATLVGTGTAGAQGRLLDPQPAYPLCQCNTKPAPWPDPALKQAADEQGQRSVEKLTAWPAPQIVPKPADWPSATNVIPAGWSRLGKPQPAPLSILSEPGGLLDKHEQRFRQWASLGGEVEIRGMCQSACTLVMSNVPRERICFSRAGYLNFHKARNVDDNQPSLWYTRWMVGTYPDDIRAWIEARGGVEKMPLETFWTLRADELWQMGYRKCPD